MLKGFIIGVFATWFVFGVIAHINERAILDERFFYFITFPFIIICLPFAFVWMFTTSKQFRKDFFKKFNKKA